MHESTAGIREVVGVTPAYSSAAVVAIVKDVLHSPVGTEVAMLEIKKGVYYGLDPVGAHVWKYLATPRTIAELETFILDEYEVDAETCRRDLHALLLDMQQAGLIEIRA